MEPADGRAPTREHVFPKSLGGSTVIEACEACNNRRLGSKVEGRLQSATSLLRLVRASGGEAGRRLVGHPPESDQRVEVDLATGTHRLHPKVVPGEKTRQVPGDPAKVREIIIGMGMSPVAVDALIAEAEVRIVDMVEITLTEPLERHLQLSAKCALAAAVWVDPDFVDSATADGLRAALDDPDRARDQGLQVDLPRAAVEAMQAGLDAQAERMGVEPVPIVVSDCQVTYVRHQGGVLAVVRVAGVDLLAGPFLPDGAVPLDDAQTDIVVIEQSEHGLEVRQPLLELALAATRKHDVPVDGAPATALDAVV